MAARHNLSPQFRTLYRGLWNVKPEDIGQRELGSHWTSDPSVALHFAQGSHADYASPDEEMVEQGTVIEAKVHKRHIVDPNSEEWEGWNMADQVFGPESHEKEHTVRPGGIVHVTNMWDVDTDPETWKPKERQVKPTQKRGWRA